MNKKLMIYMILVLITILVVVSCSKDKQNQNLNTEVLNTNENTKELEFNESTNEVKNEFVTIIPKVEDGKLNSENLKTSLTLDNSLNEDFEYKRTIVFGAPNEYIESEKYEKLNENSYFSVLTNPLSTFSIDVDTASYSNMRRFIQNGMLPPVESVRIEEMVNYFDYNYKEPDGKAPISITSEIGIAPWNTEHKLVMIGLKGKDIKRKDLPKSNIVFLLDVSGSMDEPNKLPLLQKSFSMLVQQLGENDKISIVVYAGSHGVVIDGKRGDQKEEILEAINNLYASGSTAGAEGIQSAYELALKHFIKGGNNRVILATDGDFNVGISSNEELINFIEEKRESEIFLSVLGFGTGNLNDSMMESLANNGNGMYSYIDSVLEAKKVLVNELYSSLFTIAKDTKIQVEFNPAKVKEYRLIGYENRILNNEDFENDSVDAGEIGVGHTITAFYEIIPYGSSESKTPTLKYQTSETKISDEWSNEWLEIRVRYKLPDEDESKLLIKPVILKRIRAFNSSNFNFASSVIEFGMLLSDSKYLSKASYESIIKRAKASKGIDSNGYRAQFIQLVETAEILDN